VIEVNVTCSKVATFSEYGCRGITEIVIRVCLLLPSSKPNHPTKVRDAVEISHIIKIRCERIMNYIIQVNLIFLQMKAIRNTDFVNSYRVEEFKARAVDPANSNFSILAIALDAGFNSKSSFNQAFKKFTGKTPSQYMSET
jgi:AraC-like DNA-binding protein